MSESPLPGQLYASVEFDAEAPPGEYVRPSMVTDIERANLITSRVDAPPPKHRPYNPFEPFTHKVVLDIDLPAKLIESSTPGHYHLFIDHEIPEHKYMALLDIMAECGLIERGYVYASKERGYTAVRLPWVKKERKEIDRERY